MALFVFSGTVSSCILNISDSEVTVLTKREFTPAIFFCVDHALLTPWNWGVNN